ncbi:hypothetical protein ACNS7O_07085 [Haloferacaceae archaeon DSL9]
MGLDTLAAGIETTTKQRDRTVAVFDATGVSLSDRLEAHESSLPCAVPTAVSIVEAFQRGRSVDDCARVAETTRVTVEMVLHCCGIRGFSSIDPAAYEPLRRWLDGRCSRAETKAEMGVSEATFALATYIETHHPIPELVAATRARTSGAGAVHDAGSAPASKTGRSRSSYSESA